MPRMKRLVLGWVLASLAACGGGSKKSESTMPSTGGAASAAAPDCKAAADKVANDDAALATALAARCQSDAWSDESRACLAEKGEAGPCTLSDAQRSGIEQERARVQEDRLKEQQAAEESQKMQAEKAAAEKMQSEEGKMGKKDAPKTRGAVKKDKSKGDGKTADPCEGGE